jgi:Peptidase family M1 domain
MMGAITVNLKVRALVLGLVLMAVAPGRVPAAALEVEHQLEIELMPSAHLLTGRDVLQIRVDDRRKLVFALSERAAQLRVEVDGKPRPFEFADSQLAIPLEPDECRHTIEAVITYAASFNDSVPTASLNTDNPGFGVTGSITPTGTFLLAGAGWYPDLVDSRETFPLLRVKAPEGVLAVTSGLSLGHATRDGFTFSEWRIDNPLRGLALSAAAYVVQEKKVAGVVAATYFLPDNQDLSAAYLDAIAAYLKLYSELFGPYPFPKFAVVENFFPTGYGFSSYTLLGGSILRLPFILHTSLGHEIAHCWWGNGVFVDYEHGNWSEGLTTYVSDYLYTERESAAAARGYRLQTLRNFTTLVPPAKDFPLARFTGRVDTATKAVGYDKGMMVFHMLRKAIGEEAFWGALRDVCRERLFQPTAWDDLRRAFEKRSERSLKAFFDQWVNRKGAPRIHLADVRRERAPDGWKATGRLSQEKPFFNAEFELALDGGGRQVSRRIEISGKSAPFEVFAASEPVQIVVDPDYDMLRRLDPSEIPPTVNALKSSASTLLVVCETAAGRGQKVADTLAGSLGLGNFATLPEAQVDRRRFNGQDVILVGYPRTIAWLSTLPASLHLQKEGFSLGGVQGSKDGDIFFGVFTNPYDPGRVLAVLLPIDSPDAANVAAKITHYGRFSYLIFRDGQNRDKGSWETADSPVVHRWK